MATFQPPCCAAALFSLPLAADQGVHHQARHLVTLLPTACRDGSQRHVSLVRFGLLEAVSPDAAVHHIDAAAAAMETADAGLGETSGGIPRCCIFLFVLPAEHSCQFCFSRSESPLAWLGRLRWFGAPLASSHLTSPYPPPGTSGLRAQQPQQCRHGFLLIFSCVLPPNSHLAAPALFNPAGQSSQLASRLQSLRQQLRSLQQQIDACDDAVEESRARKRQRLERQQGAQGAARRGGQPHRGGGGSREGSREGSEGGSSSMDVSEGGSDGGSASEEGRGAAAGGDTTADSPFPSSQEVRQQLGPLLQRKQQLKKEAAAAAAALQASSAAVAARRKELRAAVVAQVGWVEVSAGGGWGKSTYTVRLLCHNSSAVCQVCVFLQQAALSQVLGYPPTSLSLLSGLC